MPRDREVETQVENVMQTLEHFANAFLSPTQEDQFVEILWDRMTSDSMEDELDALVELLKRVQR